MPKAIDETGNRYGKLTVIKRVHPNGHHSGAYWLCECDCGGRIVALGGNLRSGNTTSCGCKTRHSTVWGKFEAKKHG